MKMDPGNFKPEPTDNDKRVAEALIRSVALQNFSNYVREALNKGFEEKESRKRMGQLLLLGITREELLEVIENITQEIKDKIREGLE